MSISSTALGVSQAAGQLSAFRDLSFPTGIAMHSAPFPADIGAAKVEYITQRHALTRAAQTGFG
jgi:hypothetical protein